MGGFQLAILTKFQISLIFYALFFLWGVAKFFLLILREKSNGIILHPWQRDTGKYAAQGLNIISPEAPMMPPEARRVELEG